MRLVHRCEPGAGIGYFDRQYGGVAGLVDNGLLNKPPGQVAVGWLVLEDLATIAILVLLAAVVGCAGVTTCAF